MIRTWSSYLVFITYAISVLMGFGTILTWVERKQSAVMSDRIGANPRLHPPAVHPRSSWFWWGCSTAWPTA